MLRNFDQEDLQEWCVTPWSGTFPFEGMDGGTASDGSTDAVEADKRERKGGHGSLKYRQCLHNRIVVKLYIARNNDKRGLLAYVLCI